MPLKLKCHNIALETFWEHDPDSKFSELVYPGGAFENEDPEDWVCWQSEVRATCIIGGKVITGHAYLGSTWEKACSDPSESNPDINGYYPGMVEASLQDLRRNIFHAGEKPDCVDCELSRLLKEIKAYCEKRYDEQRMKTVKKTVAKRGWKSCLPRSKKPLLNI